MSIDKLVFDGSDKFEITGWERQDTIIRIAVVSNQRCSKCPGCSVMSSSVHSYYNRSVMDLPMLGYQTWLMLRARKFRCLNSCCERKIFAERFDDHFLKGKRLSVRLKDRIEKIAFYAGGNSGARLCRMMNVPVSGSTLIRTIYSHKLPETPVPRVLGIDDWAFKKRLSYGTVLVDIERGKIIDLLPDREGDTVRKWLLERPGVEVVTRDRFTQFANGVHRASATIIHVADRWHLIKNLGDAVQKVIDRCYMKLKANRRQEYEADKDAKDQKPVISLQAHAATGKLQKKFAEVKLMLAQGYNLSHISRTVKVERRTIRKWREYPILPAKRSPKQTNMFLYADKVKELISLNPQIETKEIWARIRELGYTASQTTAYEQIGRIRGKDWRPSMQKVPELFWIPSRTSRLLYTKRDKLSNREREIIDNLCSASEEIRRTDELVRFFKEMLESKAGHLLKTWINQAIGSGIKELKSFARGMLSDYSAVENGINLPWSNGPVEGQVNKLKLIKRQMYGRAGFELLRRRMIYDGIY